MELVKVTWVDAYDGGSGWQDLSDIEAPEYTVESVGFLATEDDIASIEADQVVLIQGLSSDDKAFNHFVIPRAWIRKIQHLVVEEKHAKTQKRRSKS